MLQLASQAPSIGNRQMWRYIVITNPELLQMLGHQVERRIAEMTGWYQFEQNPQRLDAMRDLSLHFTSAPAVICVVKGEYNSFLCRALVERGMKATEAERMLGYPDVQSVGAMIGYLTLVAQARGYATCWLTDPLLARHDLHASLELKPGEELLALVTIGTPAEQPHAKPRKAIDDIIEWRTGPTKMTLG